MKDNVLHYYNVLIQLSISSHQIIFVFILIVKSIYFVHVFEMYEFTEDTPKNYFKLIGTINKYCLAINQYEQSFKYHV